jgi:hypothetical protein
VSVPDPTLTDWVPLNRIAAPTLSGTLANRPSASTAGLGTLYYTTDTGETYRSDGTAWTLVVRSVPNPVVNGSWVKGVGGAAVWAPILYTDVADGILDKGGDNRYRPDWTNARLEHWIDTTMVSSVPSGFNVYGPYQVTSPSIAPGVEGQVNYTHNLGATPQLVVAELEDGSFAGYCSWRVTRSNPGITFTIRNNAPSNNATAIVRFLIWL